MADNPYDLSGLYGDAPAPPPSASAPKKKSDPYDLSGLYAHSKPSPAPKVQAPPMQAAPESIGAKILNAPGVGSTLNFINDYAVQPLERVAARAGDIGGEALVQAGRRASQSALASGQVGPRVEPTIQTLINPPALPGPVEGVERGVGEVAGSVIADPRNWPFLGSAAIKNALLKRATQLGFTGLMSKGAIDQAEQIGAEWDSATPEQRAEQLTKLGINVAGAVGAGGELGKPAEAAPIPVTPKPRLNFLQPMIDNAPREGTPPLLNAEAAESAVQPKLDAARAERQIAAAEQAKAELQKPALPIDEAPSPATPPEAEPSLYDLDALYNEPKQAPSLRVGEEVPGLDQQAEQVAARSQNEGIRTQNESSPENALQADLSLGGEERANPSENARTEQGAPIAQESTPLQAEVHPKYDQIGIDADSGQPILKKKEVVPGNSPTPEEIAALKGKHGINDEPRQFVGSPGEKLAGEFRQDPASMLRRYEQIPETQGGKYVATDTAKELSGEYASSKEARRRYDQEVQGPAGDIAKAQYEARLKQITPESDRVILVTGAPGSGKSTIAKGAIDKSVNTVFEGNFTRTEVAFRYIDKAIAAGGKPEFRVVVANPETIAKRLLRRTDEIGRPVTLDYAAQVYKALPETVDRIREKYGNQVAIQIIDNTRDNVAPRRVPVEFLDSLRYTKTVQEIENELRNHAKAFHETGGSSQEAFDAVFGGRDLRQDHRNNAGERQAESGRQVNPERASQPEGSVRRGVPPAGEVGTMPTADISVNPHRFQFKLNTDAEGVGTLLKEAPHYNDELAGTISVWTDPADGKTYVINGHHRLELAKRTGQQEVAVRHIRAKDAAEARSVGALQNIAEGRGTAVDAAKFFRESGMTAEDVKASGVSLGEATARRGLALSRLDDSLFNRVVQGDLREGRAAAIGETTADHAEQKAIADLVDARERKGKTVTDETLKELIRFVRGTGQSVESTMSLFGEQQIVKSYALEKAEISAHIKGQLAKDRKLFGFVSDAGRAERLRAEKAGTVKTGKAAKISEQAAQAEEVYNRLSDRTGPVADILEKSAREIAEGGKADAVKSKAYGDIRTEISKALSGSEAGASAKSEAGPGQGTAASQKRGVSESRSASLGAPPDKAQFRNPNPSPNLIGFIEDAGSKLKIEPYHDQARLDGSVDKQFIVKDGKSYRIVTEERLRGVLEDNPEMLKIHPSKALDTYRSELLPKEEAAPSELKLEMQDAPPEKMPTLFGPGDLGEIIGPTGKQKRLISKEAYDDARQSFLDKVTRSSAGVDVSAVKDLAVIGAYHFESGIRTFAEWSKKMVAELGETVRPHLNKIWNDIQEKVANGEPLPKALARGSAAVAEKPKSLSFLKNPEAQKSGGTPPKLPTFLKTESAPEGKENFAGNINLDKYSVTDAAKQIVKDAAVTHAGFTEQRRGVQSHEQTKALAASLGLTTEELSKTRKGSAFNAEEMHAAGNLLASSAETMRKLQDKAAKTGNVNDQIAVLEAYARHVAVQQAVSGATAEAGRALNALKIIRQAQDIAGKDNRTKVLDALRERLGEDWVNHAEAITKKVSQFPEGDTASLNKFLRETAKQPFAKYVNSFYIANLLSGTKTVLKKAGGDLALGLIQHPLRVAEGLIDASTHKILGRNQEHFVREALPAAQAYVYAMPKAIQKFAYVMKNGFTPEQANALEIPGIVELPGGLKNPLNHATRALSATAEMFKTMALEGELAAEATRQAIKEGATGQALDRRIRQLVTERPPELIERAAKQSKYETYTSDGDGMVKAAQYIQSLFKIPEDFAIKPLRGFEPMRLVIPFAKVPWNIAKIGIEYGTPARALSFLSQEGRSAKNFAPNTAKALIGSSVFAIGYSLAQQGNLTGPIPKDQKEKEAFFGEGKQPYSVKIGDQWVSYHVVPPLAMGWAAAAALHDTKGDPAPDRILEIGSAVAKSLTDASFFRGLNNVMEAIQDPGSIGSKVKQLGAGMASGFVPLSSLLRQVSHAKDSTVRDADTIYDRVKANIPILEEELPAKVDRFGRPVTRHGDEGLKAFLPLQPADSQSLSRIDQEVDRLDVKIPDVGKTVSIKNKQFELSKDQQRELQKLSGNETFRMLGELLSKDQYKQLDDEKKSLVVERAIHAAREKSRMEYIQKNFKTLAPKPATPKFFGQPAN